MADKTHIAIVGAGLMGHGIALTFARNGLSVSVTDPDSSVLDSTPERVAESMHLLGAGRTEIDAALINVRLCRDLAEAVSDANYVFEAAPEKLELKQAIFAELEAHAPENAVLASNTSVIMISKITGGLGSRRRALGTHWWNPPHMIPLVEIVKTTWVDQTVVDRMFGLLSDAGKKPVIVEKDVPGFIGNRLQHALWREAISLVENGICSAEAVDDVVKASFGRRLAVLGPLENADLVGIELTRDIHKQVLFDLETRRTPSPYLQDLLDAGREGMSAGSGFRRWGKADLAATKSRVAEHLKRLETILPS